MSAAPVVHNTQRPPDMQTQLSGRVGAAADAQQGWQAGNSGG